MAPGASASEVRAAWRRASRRTHPDLGGSADAFRDVLDAYRLIAGPGGTATDAAADSPFLWPHDPSEAELGTWPRRPHRAVMASIAMLLCLLLMVVLLLAPAVLAVGAS